MDSITFQRPWPQASSKRRTSAIRTLWFLVFLAQLITVAVAQDCISLTGSTACPAFSDASISTDSELRALYPFLDFVSTTEEFDDQLNDYIMNGYVQRKYENTLGCDNVNLDNTSALYARYTTSFLCNGIVQNSRQPCGTSVAAARPLCADSCVRLSLGLSHDFFRHLSPLTYPLQAELALSQEKVISNDQLCGNPVDNYIELIRADFTNCALPAESLSEGCIAGAQNEPNNCGFGSSLTGLCDYCRASSENATDSCCIGSDAVNRCEDVVLPQFSLNPTLLPTSIPSSTSGSSSSSTASASDSSESASDDNGLSPGAIAGIVIGSVVAAALILTLLAICFFFVVRRRRERSRSSSLLNQPAPQRRQGPTMQQVAPPSSPNGYEVLPGGRVARMSALQSPAGGSSVAGTGPAAGVGHRREHDTSESEAYGDSSTSDNKVQRRVASKRTGSLSSSSVFPVGQDSSPNSGSNGQYSSPEGVNSGQSEQLASFKDYYSNDEIHPNDQVSVLWAYEPRAGDEFELERGDMLKVVGIWDDGWATGMRIDDRAEDYEGKHQVQRDSGVSHGSDSRTKSSPANGEIKAFPLVCVCSPEAWKKTVEGEASTESGSVTHPGGRS